MISLRSSSRTRRRRARFAIATLTRVLSAAITTREEYSGGFVICGVAWETASPATLVKALRRALGMRKAAPAPALPPEDADPDEWEAPAEEEGAFALHAAKRLTVISLAIEAAPRARARKRRRRRRKATGRRRNSGRRSPRRTRRLSRRPSLVRRMRRMRPNTSTSAPRTPPRTGRFWRRCFPCSGRARRPTSTRGPRRLTPARSRRRTRTYLHGSTLSPPARPSRPSRRTGSRRTSSSRWSQRARRAPTESRSHRSRSSRPPCSRGGRRRRGRGRRGRGRRGRRIPRKPPPRRSQTTRTSRPRRRRGGGRSRRRRRRRRRRRDADADPLGDPRGRRDDGGGAASPRPPRARLRPLMRSSASAAIVPCSRRFASSGGASTRASRRTPETLFTAERSSSRGDSPRSSAERLPGCSGRARAITCEFGVLVNDLPEPTPERPGSVGRRCRKATRRVPAASPVGDAEDAPTEAPPRTPTKPTKRGKTTRRKPPRENLPESGRNRRRSRDPPTSRATCAPGVSPARERGARAGRPRVRRASGASRTFRLGAEMTLAPGESREVKVTAYPKGDLPTPADAEERGSPTERTCGTAPRASGVIAATVEGNPHPARSRCRAFRRAPSVAVGPRPEKTAAKKRAAEARPAGAAAARKTAAAEKKRASVSGRRRSPRSGARRRRRRAFRRRQPKADGRGRRLQAEGACRRRNRRGGGGNPGA